MAWRGRVGADAAVRFDHPMRTTADIDGGVVEGHAGGESRPRVLVTSYSHIASDARVLRQAEYLSRHFDVVLAGWGEPVTRYPGVQWRGLPSERTRLQQLAGLALLALGRVVPAAYQLWFRFRPGHAEARALAIAERCDAYYANDWLTLPAMAEGAKHNGGALVFDAHEYSPLEWESSRLWRIFYRPLVLHVLRRYASSCAASVTVAGPIAERYAREFGLDPMVVLNAPAIGPLPPPSPPGEAIRLIHHGSAIRERKLERMVDVLAHADGRFRLDFMLVGDPGYVAELRAYAEQRVPGRVRFVPPVAPTSIVDVLRDYDLGLFLLDTDIYNYEMAMPNKLFDFIAAGLGVCIGPSPAMREVVAAHGCGVVAAAMEPASCAAALNALTAEDVGRMKGAARVARECLNADIEMEKLVGLMRRVVEGTGDLGRGSPALVRQRSAS